jgi:hypothetical protein
MPGRSHQTGFAPATASVSSSRLRNSSIPLRHVNRHQSSADHPMEAGSIGGVFGVPDRPDMSGFVRYLSGCPSCCRRPRRAQSRSKRSNCSVKAIMVTSVLTSP